MPKIPYFEIVTDAIKTVVTLFDDFYNKGWFLYLIVGLFILVFVIVAWG